MGIVSSIQDMTFCSQSSFAKEASPSSSVWNALNFCGAVTRNPCAMPVAPRFFADFVTTFRFFFEGGRYLRGYGFWRLSFF